MTALLQILRRFRLPGSSSGSCPTTNSVQHREAKESRLRATTWILVVGISAAAACTRSAPKEDLPVFGAAPHIRLTRQDGTTFDSRSLRGQVWAFGSFFTSCPDVCPALLTQLRRIEQDLGPEHTIRFVLLTVDPETDTAEHLGRFAEKQQLDPSRWTLLTGDQQDISATLNAGFRLGGGEVPSMHSARLALIDSEQQVRGYFDGLEKESMDLMRTGMQELLKR